MSVRSESPGSSLPCSSVFITSLIGQLAVCNRTQELPDGISTIPNAGDDEGDSPRNPLSQLSADVLAKVKPLLLTLHCLFPSELLLALDILDRSLITRYTVKPRDRRPRGGTTHCLGHEGDGREIEVYCGKVPREQQQHHYMDEDDDYEGECFDSEIYFVLSSASKRRLGAEEDTRHRQQENEYQVCLDAWNCTCPAFTLATFRDLDSEDDEAGPQTKSDIELPISNEPVDTITKRKNWVFGGCLTQSTPLSGFIWQQSKEV
ncbi:hypothetical protein MGYG_06360 [Nannizzia gypsea CBS 118893]|uniref:SWIM-type domain-containing protein n=1 Tax=Arthroderma gypseum (strain ATCC MYA-4604 / CBS 118893) TaxID=535722 RepID=E4UZ32_ARTGP|nr:hypothetical protein MGYG_06360 [Nannizzia gypsea CBS 118893]EFR03362.1 hypothetical protein MGYG_06360 [Nannizzia gypsea CBS 118893]